MELNINVVKQIQRRIGMPANEIDGVLGEQTLEAISAAVTKYVPASLATPIQLEPTQIVHVGNEIIHAVKASSFADPADVAAFRRCKSEGKSDQECYLVGDSGEGKWGDDCSLEGGQLCCALPPEDWEEFGEKARGKEVLVAINGKTLTLRLLDTMPHRENIKNGAGIDIGPVAVEAFGEKPPMMVPATWQWKPENLS